MLGTGHAGCRLGSAAAIEQYEQLRDHTWQGTEPDGSTPLYVDSLRAWVETGGSVVDARFGDSRGTALIEAANGGHREAVEWLLDNGRATRVDRASLPTSCPPEQAGAWDGPRRHTRHTVLAGLAATSGCGDGCELPAQERNAACARIDEAKAAQQRRDDAAAALQALVAADPLKMEVEAATKALRSAMEADVDSQSLAGPQKKINEAELLQRRAAPAMRRKYFAGSSSTLSSWPGWRMTSQSMSSCAGRPVLTTFQAWPSTSFVPSCTSPRRSRQSKPKKSQHTLKSNARCRQRPLRPMSVCSGTTLELSSCLMASTSRSDDTVSVAAC